MRAWLLLLLSLPAFARGAPFEWPKVPALEGADSAQIVRVKGVPVRLTVLRVKQDAHKLLQTYADAFVQAGLYIPPDKDQLQLAANGPMLTALDPDRHLTYTVVLQPQADGLTTVILGEANFALRDPTEANDFAPVFPGARGVLRSSQESQSTIAFDAPAKPAELEKFYRDVLPTVGYQPDDKDPSEWRRGNERLHLTVATTQAGTSVVLVHRNANGP